MENKFTVTQLGVLVVFAITIGAAILFGANWLNSNFGSPVAITAVVAVGFIMYGFAQQFFTAKIVQNALGMVVAYEREQVKVKHENVKVQVEQAKMMKEAMRIEGRSAAETQRQLEEHLRKLAPMYARSEIETLRRQMMLASGGADGAQYEEEEFKLE